MGWTFESTPRAKKDFIADRLREQVTHDAAGNLERSWTVTHHALRGSHLWKVVEVRDSAHDLIDHFIALDLISGQHRKGDDPALRGCWGYKDLCESVGPTAYDCPLTFLDIVPPDDKYGWRDNVRAWHKAQAESRKRRQSIKAGQTWGVVPNEAGVTHCIILGKTARRGTWAVRDAATGHNYTMRTQMLTKQQRESAGGDQLKAAELAA